MANSDLLEISKIQPKKEKTPIVVTKSSKEILSELFGVFNAEPPTIMDLPSSSKKSKKSKKKKHKERKKKSEKRGRSSSDHSDSDAEPVKKKSKKSKHKKKRRSNSKDSKPSKKRSYSPDPILTTKVLMESSKIEKSSKQRKVTLDMGQFCIKVENDRQEKKRLENMNRNSKVEQQIELNIPIPKNPDVSQIKLPDEHHGANAKISGQDNGDKNKMGGNNKIQIKNLKFSSVFEANVKQAEEEARKKAEKYEDGELSESSMSSEVKAVSDADSDVEPRTPDLREKLNDLALTVKSVHNDRKRGDKGKATDINSCRSRSKSVEKTVKSHSKSHHTSSRSRKRSRSDSRSRRSPSRSRSRSRNRSRSRRSHSRSRTSRSTKHHRDKSDERRSHRHDRRRSKEKALEIDKKRLLEIARKNAINMLQTGSLPVVSTLGPHAQQKVISAIKSGGKSVDELTDFCKNLSRQEAMGELSSVTSDSDLDGELHDIEVRPFHHPFQVKDKAPIVLNIKGGTPLPTQSFQEKTIEQSKVLRLQFPVSSGSQHRGAEGEWRPVSPPSSTSVAKITKMSASQPPKHAPHPPLTAATNMQQLSSGVTLSQSAVPETPLTSAEPLTVQNQNSQSLVSAEYNNVIIPPPVVSGIIQPPVTPAILPGPQIFPSEVNTNINIGSIVSQRLSAIRKLQQNPHDVGAISKMYQVNKEMSKWAQSKQEPGQFTGSTGAQILTPRELASGYQAWAKRDQLQTAAPLSGGMGMHLLQKMGWRPGEGLGKGKNGSLTPLMLEVKLDTRGLVAKEETRQRNNVRRPAAPSVNSLAGKHPVSLLGEYCSKRKLGVPSYTLCFECGPDHKKNFLFKVTVNGIDYQPSVASANKKQAKADAAQLCLQKIGLSS